MWHAVLRMPKFRLPVFWIAGVLLLSAGCTVPTQDEPQDTAESAATAADTAVADVDAAGRVTVRASVLTVTFVDAGRMEIRNGESVLILNGRSSRDLDSVFAFVPDDAFGVAKLTGSRSFEVSLRGGHEINTVLSGLPLGLQIQTRHGTPRRYEAQLHVGASLGNLAGDARLRLGGPLRPVYIGDAGDPLRYRLDIQTTSTPSGLSVAAALAQPVQALRLSPRRYQDDWTFDTLMGAAGSGVTFASKYGTQTATTTANVDLRVRRLGLTSKTAEQAWPNTCVASVSRCLSRADSADLSGCGSYRQITTCQNQEPPVEPAVATLASRIAAKILAETGIQYEPAVVVHQRDGNRTLAQVGLASGGLVEFAVGPGTQVTLERFVDRPSFVDSFQVARFEKQLRTQHGMPNARIVAHGTPAGMAPRWHLVVDRNGQRSTVAIEATSESTSKLIPFQFDAGAFRAIAGALAVEHAIGMASQASLYAELEVYLRAIAVVGAPDGLKSVALADSPVGFVPATETQLAFYSAWGDNAVFVTINKSTGATRTEDFN
jgi:hypothetical protein